MADELIRDESFSNLQPLWVGSALRTALLLDCARTGERTFVAIQFAFPQLRLQAAVKSRKGRCGLVADPQTVGTAVCVVLAHVGGVPEDTLQLSKPSAQLPCLPLNPAHC